MRDAVAASAEGVTSEDVGGGSSETWPQRILLDTPEGCERELMRCTNGLAFLDHYFTLTVDALEVAEMAWEDFQSMAHADIPKRSGITASEIKSAVLVWVADHEEEGAREAYEKVRELEAELKKIDRYYKSLEKRGTHAQSALNRHMGGAKYGGVV